VLVHVADAASAASAEDEARSPARGRPRRAPRGPNLIYVDSSALVKLVVEPESVPLRDVLERDADQITSAIVEIEVVRAVRRTVPELTAQAQRVVSQIGVVEPTEAIRARAARLDPVTLRSLDALHLATALEVRDELDGFVTYDGRMANAAQTLGLAVLAPK